MEHKNVDKAMSTEKQVGFYVHTHTWLFNITGHRAFIIISIRVTTCLLSSLHGLLHVII